MMTDLEALRLACDAVNEKTEGGCSATPCYALVLYTYDYYEWEETLAVSFDAAKLKDEYEGLDHLYSDRPIVAEDDHRLWAGREDVHWVIEPVKFLA